MSNRIQLALKSVCDDRYEEVKFYNGYSGRGMYGRKCVGITGSAEGCMNVISNVIKLFAEERANNTCSAVFFEEAADTLLSMSRDSMGQNIILYWQSLDALTEEDNKED